MRGLEGVTLVQRCASSCDHRTCNHFEAERLGGLEVDHELEFGGLHDRQVGRFLALENPSGDYARDIAARPIQAGDEAVYDRVAPVREDNRNRRGCGLGCKRSQTVRDLVAGSGLALEDRGTHTLKGVPNEWRLFRAILD
jgi:hypothetical protein